MPVPKRSEERRRRNKTAPIEKAPAGEAVVVAPALPPGMHQMAQDWYASLARSGQARFYEASDWAMAQVMARALDDYLNEPSAALLRAFLVGSEALLVTDGARRRMRLELIRRMAPERAEPTHQTLVSRARLRAIDGDAVDLDGTAG